MHIWKPVLSGTHAPPAPQATVAEAHATPFWDHESDGTAGVWAEGEQPAEEGLEVAWA